MRLPFLKVTRISNLFRDVTVEVKQRQRKHQKRFTEGWFGEVREGIEPICRHINPCVTLNPQTATL